MENEKRLIDADAEIEAIKKYACEDCESYNGIRCRACWADDLIGWIEGAPKVDAVEVVHGRNETKQHPVDEFICSVCGYVCHETHKYVYDEDGEDWSMYEFEFKYCPNCGAKMDGDGDGTTKD